MIGQQSNQKMEIARIRMATAQNGLLLASAKRTLFTWWAPRDCLDFVGRVVGCVHPRKKAIVHSRVRFFAYVSYTQGKVNHLIIVVLVYKY